jgi:hypothetical protein
MLRDEKRRRLPDDIHLIMNNLRIGVKVLDSKASLSHYAGFLRNTLGSG